MASGHVNRTNRPNTWLHRPSLRREESPCQSGAVHTWHFSDVSGTAPLRQLLKQDRTTAASVIHAGQSTPSALFQARC